MTDRELMQPAQPQQDGMAEFLADLRRSRTKYPRNRRMFDGLMGEVDELRRAYAGDGDMRAEAFDVAVCAFRIATEGDAGGNTTLEPAQPQERLTKAEQRMLHDFPHLAQFHRKHALGPMLPPSCLCCGQQTDPITRPVAVKHMELPGIVICEPCHSNATAQQQKPVAGLQAALKQLNL